MFWTRLDDFILMKHVTIGPFMANWRYTQIHNLGVCSRTVNGKCRPVPQPYISSPDFCCVLCFHFELPLLTLPNWEVWPMFQLRGYQESEQWCSQPSWNNVMQYWGQNFWLWIIMTTRDHGKLRLTQHKIRKKLIKLKMYKLMQS